MRRLWRAMGAAVPLVALACGVDEAEGARGGSARDFPALSSTRTLAPEPTPSADAAADAAAYAAADPAPDTATYEGDGFSFRYPSDATIGTLTHEAVQVAEQTHQLLTAIELRGPALRDDEGNPIIEDGRPKRRRGSLALFGTDRRRHGEFADHILAEAGCTP